MNIIFSRNHTTKYCLWLFVFLLCLAIIIFHLNFLNDIQFNFNVFHNATLRYPYIAVIVDDRATQLAVNAVNNVLQHIPIDWKVKIFTHIEHWSFYKKSSLAPLISTGRVFMTPIDFPRNNLSGGDYINSILTSSSFWRRVQGDQVLYFQIDAVLCSNSAYKLTDFLQYDFIGAPWHRGGCCNGGLSIRSRTKTLKMLENGSLHFHLDGINEDGWYSNNLPSFNGIVVPIDIARTFSVETVYHPRPFAVHNPYIDYIGRENMTRLCDECPETKTISSHCQ